MVRVSFHPFHASPSCCSARRHVAVMPGARFSVCGDVSSVFLVRLILPSSAIALVAQASACIIGSSDTKYKS